MPEPTISQIPEPSPNVQPTIAAAQPTSNKLPWTLLAVVVIVIALVAAWMVPAEQSIQKENLSLKTENESLKTQLNESKSTTTYYPNGRIKSRTNIIISKKTSQIDNKVDRQDQKYSKITKRNISSVAVLFGDSYIPKGADFSTNLIGPFGATGLVLWDKNFTVMVGPQYSF